MENVQNVKTVGNQERYNPNAQNDAMKREIDKSEYARKKVSNAIKTALKDEETKKATLDFIFNKDSKANPLKEVRSEAKSKSTVKKEVKEESK